MRREELIERVKKEGETLSNSQLDAVLGVINEYKHDVLHSVMARAKAFRDVEAYKIGNAPTAIHALLRVLMPINGDPQLPPNQKRIAYIAHQVKGDLEWNFADIRRIVKRVNL